jgi:hypothetical protein
MEVCINAPLLETKSRSIIKLFTRCTLPEALRMDPGEKQTCSNILQCVSALKQPTSIKPPPLSLTTTPLSLTTRAAVLRYHGELFSSAASSCSAPMEMKEIQLIVARAVNFKRVHPSAIENQRTQWPSTSRVIQALNSARYVAALKTRLSLFSRPQNSPLQLETPALPPTLATPTCRTQARQSQTDMPARI